MYRPTLKDPQKIFRKGASNVTSEMRILTLYVKIT